MKTFEVRFVEVYHVEAEDEDVAYNLALAYENEPDTLTDAEMNHVDYRHGDDSTREI